MPAVSWTEKYRPRTLSEVIGNEEAKSAFVKWLNSWKRGKPFKKAVLLYGPPGCGKTTLVYAIANDLGYEVLEANASDVRNSAALQRRIERAIREGSLFGATSKIILLDEVDGINPREDAGGLNKIIDMINETRYPIVMTANDPWSPNLRRLRDVSLTIELKPLHVRDIVKILRKICEKEGVNVDPQVLRQLAKRSRGDLRAAINDLQAISEGKREVSLKDLEMLSSRSQQINMFEITRRVLTATTVEQAKSVLLMPSLDYEMLIQFINENLPYQYDDPQALAEAYDALSKADVIMGRIKRSQDWSLLPYALELATAGVALVSNKPKFKWVRYSFPAKLKRLSRSKEVRVQREALLEAIAKKCHVSKATANVEILPYIKLIYEVNPKMGKGILRWLEIGERAFKRITGLN